MIYVFIDSNIFIGANYDFEAIQFLRLKYLLKSNLAILLYTDIIKEEVRSHLPIDLERYIKEYNKLKVKVFGALHGDSKYEKIDPKSAIDDAMKAWEDLLFNKSAEKLSLDKVNINELVRNHFDRKRPFSNDKPNEFKDAINALLLFEFAERSKDKISIISKDKGFREAFENHELFEVFEKPSDFFKTHENLIDGYNINDKICKVCKTHFRKDERFILRKIHRHILDNTKFTIENTMGYTHIDGSIMDIKDLTINYEYIRYDVPKNQLIVNVSFSIALDNFYRNNTTSKFSETAQKYIDIDIEEFEEVYKGELDIRYDIQLDASGENYKSIDLVEEYMQLDLDESMLVKRIEIRGYNGSSNEEMICPGCGKTVDRKLMNGGFCEWCINNGSVD